jgi:hypothetical protein
MRYCNTKKKPNKTAEVYYTGIGSNGKDTYTYDEFIKLMHKINDPNEAPENRVEEEHRVKSPSTMNLKKWIKWSGATTFC